MAPRDLDDEDALPPAQPRRTLPEAASPTTRSMGHRRGGGVTAAAPTRQMTHGCTRTRTVDNMVQEVDVVLVGDADDLAAALKALDTALEEGEAAAADDPAAVLRAAFNDRAAAAREPRRASASKRRRASVPTPPATPATSTRTATPIRT